MHAEELARGDLLGATSRALVEIAAPGRSAAALVDRLCLAGSSARGTDGGLGEPLQVVAFVNAQGFGGGGAYDAPEALDQLSAALKAQPPELQGRSGWSVRVLDPACRGGPWAEVHCSGGTGLQAAGEVAVQVCVTENMASSVRPVAKEPSASPASAEGRAVGGGGVMGDRLAVDEAKAAQQLQNLLSLAEGRVRRARKKGGAAAAASAALQLSYGAAESRRLFWSHQPPQALAAARAAHAVWRKAAQTAGEAAAGPATTPGSASAGWWSEEVLSLLDAMALRAFTEEAQSEAAAEGTDAAALGEDVQTLPAGSAAHAQARAHAQAHAQAHASAGEPVPAPARWERGVLVRLFGGLVAMAAASAMEGAIAGAEDDEEEEAGAAARVAQSPAGPVGSGPGEEEAGPQVPDPVFPLLDLFEAAKAALGGASGGGVQRLQRLAAESLRQLSG